MCADNWVGPDCSGPRDSNSLVWETLLDTQLTVVSTQHRQKQKKAVWLLLQHESHCSGETHTNSCDVFTHRTRRIGSSTGWATPLCQNLRVTSGCMVGCRCQRAFWEMFTGIAISQRVFPNVAVKAMVLFLDAHTLANVVCLDILCQSAVGPRC